MEQNGSKKPENEVVRLAEKLGEELKEGYSPSCSVCQHPASVSATKLYYHCDLDVSIVRRWFKEKHNRTFSTKDLATHFDKHVTPKVKQDSLFKLERMQSLMKRIEGGENNHLDRLKTATEIVMDTALTAYLNMPQGHGTKEEQEKFKSYSKIVADVT